MKKLAIIALAIACTFNVHGQNYFIKNSEWQQKIKENYFLAPLFYGVTKTTAELDSEQRLVHRLITKNGSHAYNEELISGWNYLNIGVLDSAIIHFNTAFLIDSNNLEAAYAFGTVIRFIDFKENDMHVQRSSELYLYLFNINKVFPPWQYSDFDGNDDIVLGLKSVISKQDFPILAEMLLHPHFPYKVDSGKYLVVELEGIDNKGYYKMGRKADGAWVDYMQLGIVNFYTSVGNDSQRPSFGLVHIRDTSKIYNLKNGIETGKIIDYGYYQHPRAIYYKNNSGKIDGPCEIYDDSGLLVRTEYWRNDTLDEKSTKVVHDWEEDGSVEGVMVNGHLLEYVWRDGKKTLSKDMFFGTWRYEEADITLREDSSFTFISYMTGYKTCGRFTTDGKQFILKDLQDRDSIRYSINFKTHKRKPLDPKYYTKNDSPLFDKNNELHLYYAWLGLGFKEGHIMLTKMK